MKSAQDVCVTFVNLCCSININDTAATLLPFERALKTDLITVLSMRQRYYCGINRYLNLLNETVADVYRIPKVDMMARV